MTAKMFFSWDPNGDGFETHFTEEEAKAAAQSALDAEADQASEGWSENVEEICWGKLHGSVFETSRGPAPEGSGFDELVTYEIQDRHPETEGR